MFYQTIKKQIKPTTMTNLTLEQDQIILIENALNILRTKENTILENLTEKLFSRKENKEEKKCIMVKIDKQCSIIESIDNAILHLKGLK